MEVKNWSFFQHLEEEFIKDVKLFHIFQTLGENAAFLVTRDDSVYAMGCNNYGCLGLVHENDCPNPTKIEPLCKKRLKEFACGNGHALGLTEEGRLFGWGWNYFGHVGFGANGGDVTSPALVGALRNEEIVKISAGINHSLALTANGTVFGWGFNSHGQVGVGSNAKLIMSPTEVVIRNEKIIDVKCGQLFSLALTDAGQIYVWGLNDLGQLGTDMSGSKELAPRKLSGCLEGVGIKQIACGWQHVLALSQEGDVYAWGWNDHGSIGNGTQDIQQTPLKLEVLGQVEQIACCWSSHTSTAMTRDGVFLWGGCNGEFDPAKGLFTPRRTDSSSLLEAFAKWADLSVTPETVVVGTASEPLPTVEELPFLGAASVTSSLADAVDDERADEELPSLGAASLSSSLADAVDDEELSDLTFLVEGKKIFAHKFIMRYRSEYFRKMLTGPWKEGQSREIEITDYSYDTFKLYLDFLYKGTVSASPEEAADLMVLADCYCESDLKQLCGAILERAEIAVANAAAIYGAAVKCGKEGLKEKCFRYMFRNLREVQETAEFEALSEDVKKEFMVRVLWDAHRCALKSNTMPWSEDDETP